MTKSAAKATRGAVPGRSLCGIILVSEIGFTGGHAALPLTTVAVVRLGSSGFNSSDVHCVIPLCNPFSLGTQARKRTPEPGAHPPHKCKRTEQVTELAELEAKPLDELQELATGLSIADCEKLRKRDLVVQIMRAQAEQNGSVWTQGVLEVLPEGYGFLRTKNYLPSPEDVYVSQSQIKRLGLRTGDTVVGGVRSPKSGERYYSLLKVEGINGASPEAARYRKPFDELTPVYPSEKLRMEADASTISGRVIDLVAPIGKGQRGLIVSPPKAGKTTLLKQIANSITRNNPEVHLLVLLIDERPEEVTDIRRSVDGEVAASTFDELPENHLKLQEIVLEHAKRLVEAEAGCGGAAGLARPVSRGPLT